VIAAELLVDRCVLVQVYRALGIVAKQHTVGIGGTLVLFVDISAVVEVFALVSWHESNLRLLVSRI
jgi:hypothetical protein